MILCNTARGSSRSGGGALYSSFFNADPFNRPVPAKLVVDGVEARDNEEDRGPNGGLGGRGPGPCGLRGAGDARPCGGGVAEGVGCCEKRSSHMLKGFMTCSPLLRVKMWSHYLEQPNSYGRSSCSPSFGVHDFASARRNQRHAAARFGLSGEFDVRISFRTTAQPCYCHQQPPSKSHSISPLTESLLPRIQSLVKHLHLFKMADDAQVRPNPSTFAPPKAVCKCCKCLLLGFSID